MADAADGADASSSFGLVSNVGTMGVDTCRWWSTVREGTEGIYAE